MNWRIKPLDAILASAEKKSLARTLGAFQLTMLGVGAVIGTGIFVLTAEAAPTEVHVLKVQQLTAGQVLNTATPTGSDVLRFVELVREADKEKESATQWAESYTELVDAYEHAVEHYEWAQLAAEFGIVLCSIALLLNKKPVWFGAVAFGLGSVGLLVYAFSTQHSAMATARKDIEEHKKAYLDLGGQEKNAKGDEELIADIERIEHKTAEKEKPAGAH